MGDTRLNSGRDRERRAMTELRTEAPPEREPHTEDTAEHASLVELLTACGAESLPHPGGTLLAHLQRTARRLESWGAPHALIKAGLCHAAYGTQGYPTALLAVRHRERLRAEIGDEAEAIVYAYCACDRAYEAAGSGELRDRFSGEYWVPAERMRRQLAELTAANELDVAEHAQLSRDELGAIARALVAVAPKLSQASWSTLMASAIMRDVAFRAAAPSGDCELAYRDLGSHGPHVVLWHGGASPELTWARQHALSADLQLRIPWRRGIAPSGPAARQDWAADTRDLLRIMPHRAHVVAHSWGGVSALIAAATAPERIASLTIIEPPLWAYAAQDPDVQQLAVLARAFVQGEPSARAAFLALAGMPLDHPQTVRTELLARNLRDPGEACPSLTQLRAAGVPSAIVSGAHTRGIESVCDALSSALGAQRWVIPGAGHAVQRTPEFNPRLRAHIAAASGRVAS
jgi:pimeloyl-ACP methyl ester carboxylesterase